MKTFIITLPEATKRQDHMRDQMAQQNITDFEFFDAVDGRGFDVPNHPIYDKTRRRLFFGRDMKGGEIGLILSYKNLYQHMINNNINQALVLEDDAALEPDFKKVLDALEKGPQDYEIIRFLGSEKVERLQQFTKRNITGNYNLNVIRTTPGGTAAYLITQEGARKMLRMLQKVYLPVDAIMGRVWDNKIVSYIVQPGLSEQDMSQEQFIGQERFKKTLDISGPMRLIFPLTRAYFKANEGFMKKYWYNKRKKQNA